MVTDALWYIKYITCSEIKAKYSNLNYFKNSKTWLIKDDYREMIKFYDKS
jgi:hypothetical protein